LVKATNKTHSESRVRSVGAQIKYSVGSTDFVFHVAVSKPRYDPSML
jgi:hypothetical protein